MNLLLIVAALLTGLQDAPRHRGYFGAKLAAAEGGIRVDDVVPGGPAEKAGLRAGDLIRQCDGKETSSVPDFVKTVQERGGGKVIRLAVSRDDREIEVEVTLDRHPQDLLEEPDLSPGLMKVRRTFDLAYGDHERQKLNLILPDTDKPFPVVMWIHAGAWSFGGRENETALGLRLAERGIGFAAISHRLTGGGWWDKKLPKEGVRHPAHIEDAARAFAWLHRHIKERGGDPGRLFVSGHSSGAHLAALLAMDSRWLKEHDLPLTAIRASIPIGGAYDMTKYHARLGEGMGKELADAHLEAILGRPEEWAAASPATYVKDAKIPMLVITEDDPGFQMYKSDFEAVVPKGSPIAFWTAENRVHANITMMMSRKEADAPRDRLIEFIRAQAND